MSIIAGGKYFKVSFCVQHEVLITKREFGNTERNEWGSSRPTTSVYICSIKSMPPTLREWAKKRKFCFFASTLHSEKVGTIFEIAQNVINARQKPVS